MVRFEVNVNIKFDRYLFDIVVIFSSLCRLTSDNSKYQRALTVIRKQMAWKLDSWMVKCLHLGNIN
jgi:hypothetical protein